MKSHSVEQPHDKLYMPGKLARALERASYLDMTLATLGALLLSTLYFAIAPQGHGIENGGRAASAFADVAYFSLVTLTSLGYGDYVPVGAGRIVAGGLVSFGLAAVALFVSKLASERSQAMVLLLHTSDRDRRLRGFSDEIARLEKELATDVAGSAVKDISRHLRELTGILEGISNYVAFHGHHSSLGSFGNTPALYRLLSELRSLAQPILGAMMLPATDADLQRRLDGILSRIVGLVRLVINMQSQRVIDWTTTILVRLRLRKLPPYISKTQLRHQAGLLMEVERGRKKAATVLTKAVVSQVLAISPAGPLRDWPKHDHKRIAAQLGISNKLVTRAIADLCAQGIISK